MSSPAHQLTTTGRLVINLLLAVVIYLLLQWLPPFPYAELAGLCVLAVMAAILQGWSVTPPAQARRDTGAGKDREGNIKWFNATKGFGFITGDDGEEVFVHYRSVNGLDKRRIKPGQRVSYQITVGDRGPQADNVSPAQ